MLRLLLLVPRVALLLAGAAAGIAIPRASTRRGGRELSRQPTARGGDLKITEQLNLLESRLQACERRLTEHDIRFEEVPTIPQLMGSVDELLTNTMNCIDRRLAEQVRSIESLRTTVARTDDLMERVLESLDALQNGADRERDAELEVSA